MRMEEVRILPPLACAAMLRGPAGIVSARILNRRSRLRLLLYNIRYATGTGPGFHLPFPGAGYLRNTSRQLEKLTEFIGAQQPDIVGLVEVDMGSSRASSVNQA